MLVLFHVKVKIDTNIFRNEFRSGRNKLKDHLLKILKIFWQNYKVRAIVSHNNKQPEK